MAEFEVVDLSGEQRAAQVADAIIGLSNGLITLGIALVGAPAMRAAMDREAPVSPLLAAFMDDEDPAGYGVDEDTRRPPEDGERWSCPEGLADADCRLAHDHYPAPVRRRGHGEG